MLLSFFEVIGELVIRDQLDSSWLMTEPGYQGNKAGTSTVTPAPSLHPYLLWKGHRAGLCKDKAGNKISNRQIQNFGLSVPALGKTSIADDLLLCAGFLPYMWISALVFRFLVVSKKQQLPLHMGQYFRCPEGVKACLSRAWCSFFDVNFWSHFITTLQTVFSHFLLKIRSWRMS